MILTIIVFLLVLGILVFAHELGHFLAAKRAGVRVEEFGFGFPPKIAAKKIGETIYSINLFPLGGFVRLFGEDGSKRDDDRSFASKSTFVRLKIIFAGVLFNIILAAVIFFFYFTFNGPTITLDPEKYAKKGSIVSEVAVMEVGGDSAAEKAGLKEGDIILSIDGNDVMKYSEVSEDISDKAGKEIKLKYIREGKDGEVNVKLDEKEGKGFLGVAGFDNYKKATYPWYLLPYLSVLETLSVFWVILKFIAFLISDLFGAGRGAVEGVAGPVGIFILTSEIVKTGFVSILRFTAILSINLAIINLIPFPALDGGRILFLTIEKIRGGKKLKPKTENAIHTAGFIVLILLIILISYRDVIRFIVNK